MEKSDYSTTRFLTKNEKISIPVIVLIIIFLLLLIFLIHKNNRLKGGTQYIFDHDNTKLSKLTILKNNDMYFKCLIETIINKNQSEKRKYLFDTTGRNYDEKNDTISDKPHTILNLRKQINLDEIKYISTIEFDEDYKNKHWVKSILSDCVNMAIMIQPEIFDNKIVLETDITNKIIPFKNIHFIYNNTFKKNNNDISKIIFKEIKYKIKKFMFLESTLLLIDIDKDYKIFKNIFEAFEFILNDVNKYTNYIFNFYQTDFELNIYIFEKVLNYTDYIKCIKSTHLKESQTSFSYGNTIFENYKQALINYQSKSNYFSKIFDINTINKSNLKLTLKNENITCPNPDCFMIEFK